MSEGNDDRGNSSHMAVDRGMPQHGSLPIPTSNNVGHALRNSHSADASLAAGVGDSLASICDQGGSKRKAGNSTSNSRRLRRGAQGMAPYPLCLQLN